MSDELVIELGRREAKSGVVKKIVVNANGVPREMTVRIPAGVGDGTLLRLPGAAPDDEILVRARVRSSARWYIAGALVLVVASGAVLVAVVGGSDPGGAPLNSSSVATSSWVPPSSVSATAPTTTVLSDPLDGLPVGDCLRNAGTDADPEMVSQSCAPGAFQVLVRKLGTVDQNACSGVVGSTATYIVQKYVVTRRGGIEISRTLSLLDSYVFCLRQL
jgi:hypothetical protein